MKNIGSWNNLALLICKYIPPTIFNSEAEGRRDEYDIFLLSRDTNKYLFSFEIVHDIDS